MSVPAPKDTEEQFMHEQPGFETLFGLARTFLPGLGLPEGAATAPELPDGNTPEARARKAESRYKTLVEHIPVVTFLVSFDNRQSEIYVSPHVESLLGYTAREWIENPILWYQRLHPDDRERWNEEFSRTVARAEPFKADYRFMAKNGRIIWIHGEATVGRDESGMPSFLQGIGYDITELKLAEEVLRRSREELDGLVKARTAEIAAVNKSLESEIKLREQIEQDMRRNLKELADVKSALDEHALVAITDPRGRITYANDKFCAISKYSRRELIGQDHRIINSGHHSKEFFRFLWNTIASGEVWKGEICNRAKDGSIYWVDTTIVPFVDPINGKPIQYVAIRNDISERKAAEAALRGSEERIRLMVEWVRDYAIFMLDSEGRVATWNSGAEKIKGYKASEIIGRHFSTFYPPEVAAAGKPAEELRIASEKGSFEEEGVRVRKDGSLFWSHVVLTAVRDEKGQLRGFAKVSQDITERKRAEARQGQLLQELKEINQELNQFAYVVSHDLKAPLRAISSLADWMVTDYGEKIGEDGRAQLNLLQGRVKRMNALVDGILRYSRLSRQHEEQSTVDLNVLVREVCELLSPPPAMVVKIAPGLPTVVCERTRLLQVFENLISNAVKYMGKPAGEINIGCEDDGFFWKLCVRDTGPGIAEKYFEKIFQIFQTLTPRDERESTGIGLAVVKKNVELFGGRIWVESELGEGSAFYFQIPKSRKAAAKTDTTFFTNANTPAAGPSGTPNQ
ncbi:MAG TPA: PAS domain S-box protein [Verrucomicrobiae bacterium]